jgi:hypothetical protein
MYGLHQWSQPRMLLTRHLAFTTWKAESILPGLEQSGVMFVCVCSLVIYSHLIHQAFLLYSISLPRFLILDCCLRHLSNTYVYHDTTREMAEQQCVVCTRPAYIFCQDCAVLEDTSTPLNVRWYCTALCQETDKLTHQMSCLGMVEKKDLLLYAKRAGELARLIFNAFIEHTWSYDIESIVLIPDQRGELRAVEVTHGPGHDNGPGGESFCKQQTGGWIYKIPWDVFRSAAEQKAKLMLLADQHSIWAFMNMGFIIKALFEGMYVDLIHPAGLTPQRRLD